LPHLDGLVLIRIANRLFGYSAIAFAAATSAFAADPRHGETLTRTMARQSAI
jgi:hypothetical protein